MIHWASASIKLEAKHIFNLSLDMWKAHYTYSHTTEVYREKSLAIIYYKLDLNKYISWTKEFGKFNMRFNGKHNDVNV